MDKEKVLKQYSKIGIISQNDLFNFLVNNNSVTVGKVKYNLKHSNEVMEFMAKFLVALDFEVTRLYLEKVCRGRKKKKQHWILAFTNGFKWFYYETCLDGMIGKYSFENYKNLTLFVVVNIINVFEGINTNEDVSLSDKYVLKEIKPLKNFDFNENSKESKKGTEIFVWDEFEVRLDSNSLVLKNEIKKDVFRRKKELSGPSLFLIGFFGTLFLCLLLVWFFSKKI